MTAPLFKRISMPHAAGRSSQGKGHRNASMTSSSMDVRLDRTLRSRIDRRRWRCMLELRAILHPPAALAFFPDCTTAPPFASINTQPPPARMPPRRSLLPSGDRHHHRCRLLRLPGSAERERTGGGSRSPSKSLRWGGSLR
jgi:hypothetical protein